MVGSDVVEYISEWDDSDRLAELGVSSVVYFDREGEEKPETVTISETMIAHKIRRPRFRRKREKHAAIRSKIIRNQLATHHTQLDPAVHDYIKQYDLYN